MKATGVLFDDVISLFSSFVNEPEFVNLHGPAEVRVGDHFGHGAIIVCFDNYELTVANVPGDKDHYSAPGVYLKVASNQMNNEHLTSAPSLIINKGGSPILLEYRMVTEEWAKNHTPELKTAFFEAVKEAKAKVDDMKVVKGLSAVSFSKAQRKLLNKVGIRNTQDIEDRGYARVYLDIKSISGQMINEDFLAALWGVVHNTHPVRVPREVVENLIQNVSELSMSDLRNHINMSDQVIERLRKVGFESMVEIRNSDIKQLTRRLFKEFGSEVGYETALAVYAATLRDGGVSVENMNPMEMADFDGIIYDVSAELRIKCEFQGGVSDGMGAVISLVRGNAFRQDF
ncbi:hypothetical protein F7U66_00240 [Vibrio parahaemolyticus]|nr:hypothetical protein [Vibrio parahaemolyticus]